MVSIWLLPRPARLEGAQVIVVCSEGRFTEVKAQGGGDQVVAGGSLLMYLGSKKSNFLPYTGMKFTISY